MYRTLRVALAAASLTATVTGGTQLVSSIAAQAGSSTVRATTAVNVRSGPSTSTEILGVLDTGDAVVATGAPQNGWVPVSYQGHAAWVMGTYLTSSAASSPEQGTSMTTGHGTRFTTANVNFRTGPSLSATILTVAQKGSSVQATGRATGTWTQVVLGGTTGWMSTQYLSTSKVGSATIVVSSTKRAQVTDYLNVRSAPSVTASLVTVLPKDTIVDVTGATQNGYTEIVWQGASRWILTSYLKLIDATSSIVVPGTPKVIATRYATGTINIWTSSSPTAGTVTQLPAGTGVQITGVVQYGRAQVVYDGATRWVTASLLSSVKVTVTSTPVVTTGGTLNTGGSSGLDNLQPAAKGIVYAVRANFPQISTMYGVRPDPLPDHPSGHAVDIMLPDYRNNAALGYTIASYMQAHASELNIKYIIFHQHIWSVARASEGWRLMADRGSDNANHMNHVHVTVN